MRVAEKLDWKGLTAMDITYTSMSVEEIEYSSAPVFAGFSICGLSYPQFTAA
jgi:hypothetical protein